MQTTDTTPNKFTELILYICRHSEGDESFGMTKLNKLLFYADFLAYMELGKPITGKEYRKHDYGPCPHGIVAVMRDLDAAKDIATRESEHYGFTQKRTFALREPDLSVFSAIEIDLVRYVIHHFRGKSAREISEQSHRFAGWQLAERGEVIPYEVALVRMDDRPLTEKERSRGLQLAEEAKQAMANA